jgi:hypothetical protein
MRSRTPPLPIVTVIGIGIALISGVVITETVFNIPGLGRLTVDAVLSATIHRAGLIQIVRCGQGAGQPDHRHLLRLPRSAHPLLTWLSSLTISPAAPLLMATAIGAIDDRLRRLLLAALIVMAILAPVSPPTTRSRSRQSRLQPPSERWWFGTDQFGRDVFSRPSMARVSLIVGLSVAAFSSLRVSRGTGLRLLPPGRRHVMRVMDRLMAIPSILLAIALITLTRPGLGIVIVAIIPEVPRVVRVVRSVVLSIRSQPISAPSPAA